MRDRVIVLAASLLTRVAKALPGRIRRTDGVSDHVQRSIWPVVARCLPAWLIVAGATLNTALAGDAYFAIKLSELQLTEGKLPSPDDPPQERVSWRNFAMVPYMRSYAVVDGEGEAYVGIPGELAGQRSLIGGVANSSLVIRAPSARDVEGRLYVAKYDATGMTMVRFRVPATNVSDKNVNSFFMAKADYYESLARERIPGSAWFAYQAKQSLLEVGRLAGEPTMGALNRFRGRGIFDGSLEDTYDLFSGGRAISENLQLDRELRVSRDANPTVDVNSLAGITIAAIDWKPYLDEQPLAIDALAAIIPEDQHAVFFSSFEDFLRTRDEVIEAGIPILQSAEPRSEDLRVAEIYERQLGTSLSVAARLIGPQLIRSVALTGSDPYFRTGTDVAVVFETDQSETLRQLLLAQAKLAASRLSGVRTSSGEVAGLSYTSLRTDDRRMSCYLAVVAKGVLLTNSLVQVKRLGEMHQAGAATLAKLPEYQYFRTRYPVGDSSESAFIFLSDATIRRWCSPRWRIGSSRRARDVAELYEMQAEQFVPLARGKIQSGPLDAGQSAARLGELRLNADGVWSSVYNTLSFQTPIAEMKIEKATEQEATAYRDWRDRYQTNWRWAFDPIGIRITASADRLAADLTVMPLIAGSEYSRFVAISRGAKIEPSDGDRHSALAHVVLSINTSSNEIRQWSSIASLMTGNSRLDLLSWLGSTIEFYCDDDPFWGALAQMDPDDLESVVRKTGFRPPVACRIGVSEPFRLAAFLVAARAFVEQTASGLTQWESRSHRDQAYVRIAPTERAKSSNQSLGEIEVYYAYVNDALVLTMNEELLKRSIDRGLGDAASKTTGNESPHTDTSTQPLPEWIGENLAAIVNRRFIDYVGLVAYREYDGAMRRLSWSNLPALNHWRQLFPEQDPVQVHETFWHAKLICPGGGKYVWNERFQTMESTVYGHPGEPSKKLDDGAPGLHLPRPLSALESANFGLTFEEQGLRARVDLRRSAPAPKK